MSRAGIQNTRPLCCLLRPIISFIQLKNSSFGWSPRSANAQNSGKRHKRVRAGEDVSAKPRWHRTSTNTWLREWQKKESKKNPKTRRIWNLTSTARKLIINVCFLPNEKKILQAEVTQEILKLYIHKLGSKKYVTFFKENRHTHFSF